MEISAIILVISCTSYDTCYDAMSDQIEHRYERQVLVDSSIDDFEVEEVSVKSNNID